MPAPASVASRVRFLGSVGLSGLHRRRGLRLRGLADFERIDSDRLGNVLELGRAKIADG
jgi:hypothetical protein